MLSPRPRGYEKLPLGFLGNRKNETLFQITIYSIFNNRIFLFHAPGGYQKYPWGPRGYEKLSLRPRFFSSHWLHASTQLKVVCFDNRLPKGCQSVAKGKPGRPGCPGPWAQALALHHLHKKLLDIDSNHLFDETLGVMKNYPWATEILGPQGL